MTLTPHQKFDIWAATANPVVWNLSTDSWVELKLYMRWVPYIDTRRINWCEILGEDDAR